MKVLSILLVTLFIIGTCTVAYAGGRRGRSIPLSDHYEREDPMGVGLNLEYKFDERYSAAVESKYDFENEETSIFLVGTIQLGKSEVE